MSESNKERDTNQRDELATARLLKLAGPRASIDDDIEARVYAQVHEEWRTATSLPDDKRTYARVHEAWRRETRPTRRLQWALPVALAASVVVAVVAVQRLPQPQPLQAPVATVVKVVGSAPGSALPATGQSMRPGDRVTTGEDEGVSLLLANSESLRLDENSTLVAQSRDTFELVRGRVYIDSGDFVYHSRQLRIDTHLGSVTDIGTQFIVAMDGERLDVAVREGRVDVASEGQTLTAVAGERLKLSDRGDVSTSRLDATDDFWAWAADLAPTFDIENRSLLDFLRWVARETGRELVFESEEMRLVAMRTDLHGSVAGFTPLEAIESIMSTTRLHYRLDANRIVISD